MQRHMHLCSSRISYENKLKGIYLNKQKIFIKFTILAFLKIKLIIIQLIIY